MRAFADSVVAVRGTARSIQLLATGALPGVRRETSGQTEAAV